MRKWSTLNVRIKWQPKITYSGNSKQGTPKQGESPLLNSKSKNGKEGTTSLKILIRIRV